jgi:short-subunit dehydrogenase involved in D-alanine esterification of teichoic acids
MRTSGLKVVVTGGGSGIGLSVARRLALNNDVVICGRDWQKLRSASDHVPRMHAHRLDVAAASVEQEVAAIVADLGGLNLLVNAAGVIEPYGIEDANAQALAERDMAINVLGSVQMSRAALPFLRKESPAAIVLFSSILALAPAPGFAVYSATKAAVHSLARSFRRELRGAVKVFDVMPDLVDTGPMHSLDVPKLTSDTVARAIVESLNRDRYEIPVGRTSAVAFASRLNPGLAEALVARAVRAR